MVNVEEARGGMFLVFTERDNRTGRDITARQFLADRDRWALIARLQNAKALAR